MSKGSLSIISGSLAVAMIGFSVSACSPTFTPNRDPYMSLTTPSVVDKKPFPTSGAPMGDDMIDPSTLSTAVPEPAQTRGAPYIEPVVIGGPDAAGPTN